MRVALVHDWLTGMRGGERVLEALLDLFPEAELFTLLHVPGSVSPGIESRPIRTSFVQKLPRAPALYRHYLPLLPAAVRGWDLDGFDLIVSSSHCVAKGVRVPAGVPHLCYCHTPMRYVWDQYGEYFGPGRAPRATRAAMALAAPVLRRWDVRTARGVGRFVANSRHVQARIRRCYGRDAAVVYPPVQVSRFRWDAAREDFHLVVSALVPYKRIDLAVAAFRGTGRRLVVVGSGPDLPRLRAMAGPGVELRGWVPEEEVADLMARCRSFLLPGVEDFGIAAVEAQAAGAPVVAYAAGGALETVRAGGQGEPGGPGVTGVFFREPSPRALAEAVARLEGMALEPKAARRNAERFAPGRFATGMRQEVARVLGG